MTLLRAALAAAAVALGQPATNVAPPAFDWPALRGVWRARLEAARREGRLPMIDIESCYNDLTVNPPVLARLLDKAGLTLIAFSPEFFGDDVNRVESLWLPSLQRLLSAEPAHFIPVPNADLARVLYYRRDPYAYLDQLLAETLRDRFPMLGEFMFVSYPSPVGLSFSSRLPSNDIIGITLQGPLAQKIFAFSQEHDIPFQMHYEVEDALLPALESMLSRYPKARVVWCHASRVRYRARSRRYDAGYVRRLIQEHPNLYFDLSSGIQPVYPGEDYWEDPGTQTKVKKEWVRLISDYPWRFMVALDLGGDQMAWVTPRIAGQRRMLESLPQEAREIVAYKAAWKLLFHEEL